MDGKCADSLGRLVSYPSYDTISFFTIGDVLVCFIDTASSMVRFYDQVIIFKPTYLRLFILCALFLVGFIIWSEGQKIVALVENMELKDIMPENATPVFLSFEEMYDLFSYLRNLLIISNFGTPGVAALLMLKIMYRSLGMGRRK